MTNKPESGGAKEKASNRTNRAFASNSEATKDLTPKSTQATLDGSAKTVNAITKYNGESALLKLPAEIKQKIWIIAITLSEPIKPIQIRQRSNKFIWSKDQIKDGCRTKVVSAVLPLAMVQLSKVCRALYEEVALTHLFYKANHFKLNSTSLVTYLVAINVPRMKAIRSITCDLEHYIKVAQIFTVLAACESLQSLKLIFHYQHHGAREAFKLPGYKEAIIAVQGLQTLKLIVCEDANHWGCGVTANVTKKLIGSMEPLLRAAMKEPRGKSPYHLETFRAAQRQADLDVHGEGRLSEDKRPGVVASRTRQQIRNLERLTDDGTIPKRLVSKYDYNGDIAWNVESVLAVRKSRGVPDSVEFQVNCESLTGVHHWERSGLPLEKSWEDISCLNSFESRQLIVQFYHKHPKAFGKKIVLDSWNHLENNYGRDDKTVKGFTKRLAEMIEREAIIKQCEAEEAAREIAKAKVKGKKTQRSKAANH